MARIDNKDAKIEAAKGRLRNAGQTYGKAFAALSAARAERDAAVREASALGMSRREVALLAGMTPGRVQQLLGNVAPYERPRGS